MGLYGMMRTGVSGMAAQANRLGAVADNIANSKMTGYKRAYTEFSSLIIPDTLGTYRPNQRAFCGPPTGTVPVQLLQ